MLPFYHIYGMVVVMCAALRTGATVHTMERFEPEVFLRTMHQEQISYAPIVPPIALFMAKHPAAKPELFSQLKTAFSGMCLGVHQPSGWATQCKHNWPKCPTFLVLLASTI